MKPGRRRFLQTAISSLSPLLAAESDPPRVVWHYEEPVTSIHKLVRTPVKIAAVELLQAGKDFFVRSTSTDGVVGLVKTKDVEDFTEIFCRRVAPYFIGKDARDLESLIDGVHTRNYKLIGQAFWCPVAYVEQSLLDMLGKVAGKPAGEFFGPVLREEIPVYLSGSGRETTAEQEVDVYVRGIRETGAKAFKLKIGGRMSRNADAYPGRTKTMCALARKSAGDGIVLYADANGSYDAKAGIEVGRMLQDLNYSFYEEPCPWEDYTETKRVADALDLPVAGGECDHRLWGYQHMIENRVIDIVQPDINYNGGLIRTARVARLARKAGLKITPHNTQTGPSGFNILQFASVTPNIGPFMEYPYRGAGKPQNWYSPQLKIVNGMIRAPKGAGMGVEFDPAYLARARRIQV